MRNIVRPHERDGASHEAWNLNVCATTVKVFRSRCSMAVFPRLIFNAWAMRER